MNKTMKTLLIAAALMSPLAGFAGDGSGGHSGNGKLFAGLFAKVNGQWVAWDEAQSFVTKDYISLDFLIKSDCYGEPGCQQSTFGKAVTYWLDHFKKYQPQVADALIKNGKKIRFRL